MILARFDFLIIIYENYDSNDNDDDDCDDDDITLTSTINNENNDYKRPQGQPNNDSFVNIGFQTLFHL